MMRFPSVLGASLERKRIQLPDDFAGEINLVAIAFQQWHQAMVNSWVPFLEELERSVPGLRYYELPTIQRLNPLSRVLINEGMRAGIRDAAARQKTITLYVDKTAFRDALALPDESTIYILAVDGGGDVLWRAQGPFSPAKTQSLMQMLRGRLVSDEAFE
jgi:hypothetical protein